MNKVVKVVKGATRGALSDSIKHHATAGNLLLMVVVAASGVGVPLLLGWADRRFQWRTSRAAGTYVAIITALILAALGPVTTSRVDTAGMGCNAITTLATTALPRIPARAAGIETAGEWRASPIYPDSPVEDLSWLRGLASGPNVVLIALEVVRRVRGPV